MKLHTFLFGIVNPKAYLLDDLIWFRVKQRILFTFFYLVVTCCLVNTRDVRHMSGP